MPSASRVASALSRCLILFLALMVLLAQIGGVKGALDLAVAALVAFVVLEWRNLPRLARLFSVGAFTAVLAGLWFRPEATAQMVSAMHQSATFACLLAMLGVLRYPARRSRLVAAAAAWLVTRPPRHAYTALSFGGHFLSLLFNVGILPLIGDMIRRAGGRFGADDPGREMMLAGMRGMSLMTIWSPMGLGFAIVTTSVAGLNAVAFLAVAFVAAMILLTVSCLTSVAVSPEVVGTDEETGQEQSVVPLLQILAACAFLMGMAILLHDGLAVSFVVATILILPLFSVAWLLLEKDGTERSVGETLHIGLQGIFETLADMRTEATFFAAATLIGAALTIFIASIPGWERIAEGQGAGLPILLLCLMAIPVTAAVAIPHTIVTVLIAQLFGHGALGIEHPIALALTLTVGWSLAIAVSPISATTLITAGQAGVPSHEVGLVWNRRYVAIQSAVAILMVSLVYFLGL